MNTFGLDKNHSQLNFEEITVEDLVIVSGGSGGSGGLGFPWEYYNPFGAYDFIFSSPSSNFNDLYFG